MKRGYGIPPVTPAREQRTPGATLSDQEMRRLIRDGEVKRGDLSITERERYREELKKARRY